MRDGIRLEQHVSRFAQGGIYAKGLEIDDGIILDFRTKNLGAEKQLG